MPEDISGELRIFGAYLCALLTSNPAMFPYFYNLTTITVAHQGELVIMVTFQDRHQFMMRISEVLGEKTV